MSIQDAAQAAVAVFPNVPVTTPYGTFGLPVVMTAIAGAETGGTYDPASQGDYGFDAGYGLCGGYSSWGLWQIHNVHAAYLTQATGSSDPCAWYRWLSVPVNCAQAALAVLGAGLDLGAWTTWSEGTYSGWLTPAQQAVATAGTVATPPPPAPPTPPIIPPAPSAGSPWPWVAVGSVGAAALVWALLPTIRRFWL